MTEDYSVHKLNNYGVRPNAQYFVNEVLKLFDQIYLNTCVKESRALKIMKVIFGTTQILYYHRNKPSCFGKASGYERFLDSQLIHVEDGAATNKEAKRIIELGYTYISVPHWGIKAAYVDKKTFDTALLIALNTIKETLQ